MTRTIITIQRTTGEVERVEFAGVAITDPATRAKTAAANLAAGRGTILSWDVRGAQAARLGCSQYSAANGCPLHGETCR